MNPDQPTAKLRVLAVDDNRTNLHILQVFLKKLGHDVVLAENGEEAVRRFTAMQPDLVLLDIMMPIMDGFEAARRIKAMAGERWVPIIFLSALNRDENLVEGLDAGGDDYLTKPVNFIVLEAKMRSMQRSLQLQRHALEACRRLQAISDNVLEAIVTFDAGARIIACNRATQLLFGWRPSELLGQDFRVLVPTSRRDGHDECAGGEVEGDPPLAVGCNVEIEAQRKDGGVFPVDLRVSEVRTEGSRMYIGVLRDISEQKRVEQQLRDNAAQLRAYYEHTQGEQQLAMKLMDKQLHRPGLKDPRLQYRLLPAENFSGDAVAATRSTRGRFYALLADATGHGLTAAISMLPVLAIFYRMAALDHSLREIVLELNQQLRESMPVGRFVAASLVCLDESQGRGEIWIGGTPPALLVDLSGQPARNFASGHMPLGISDNPDIDPSPEEFTWASGSQLVLCSDGLLEAANAAGEPFAAAGLAAAVADTSPAERMDAILAALATHRGQAVASDDVSIMLIDHL